MNKYAERRAAANDAEFTPVVPAPQGQEPSPEEVIAKKKHGWWVIPSLLLMVLATMAACSSCHANKAIPATGGDDKSPPPATSEGSTTTVVDPSTSSPALAVHTRPQASKTEGNGGKFHLKSFHLVRKDSNGNVIEDLGDVSPNDPRLHKRTTRTVTDPKKFNYFDEHGNPTSIPASIGG